jgi:microcompartment protein CcmL/EutN
VTAGIEAADAAAKEADIRLLDVRLSGGLGGKSVVKVMGALSDVEAAVAAGAGRVEAKGHLAHRVVIARPHPDLAGAGREDIWS